MDRQFDALMEEISASGEFVMAEALAATRRRRRCTAGGPRATLATDGPYAETKEQLAGFFLIDCADPRACRGDRRPFAQPGGTVELRPAMWPGGDDQ